MASSRKQCCVINPDKFCCICGKYMLPHQPRPINDFLERAYKAYFSFKMRRQDVYWIPKLACRICIENLRSWTKGIRKSLPFGRPMIWREPTNHETDCYFCMTNVNGIGRKNRSNLKYPHIASVSHPLPHSDKLPVPAFTGFAEDREEFEEDGSFTI